jgi:hypothetical protein
VRGGTYCRVIVIRGINARVAQQTVYNGAMTQSARFTNRGIVLGGRIGAPVVQQPLDDFVAASSRSYENGGIVGCTGINTLVGKQ